MAGDTHSNFEQWEYLFPIAKDLNVDVIMQLGDFGYWAHTKGGLNHLDALHDLAVEYDIPIYWLDGNHENHVHLRVNRIAVWNMFCLMAGVDPGPFVPIRGTHIVHTPRGATWEWDGVKFLAVGGAFSIDRGWRDVGESFWFEEELTDAEADYASRVGKVDVLVSHDVPMGTDMAYMFIRQGRSYRPIPQAEPNRRRLRQVVEATKPNYIYHGHYHICYKNYLELNSGHTIVVMGLGADGMEQDSWTILDTEDLTNPVG